LTDALSGASVAILSHNRIDELKETFVTLCESANVHNLELIIVDNASTDGSRELIQGCVAAFPTVKAFLSDVNTGVAAGRNLAWGMCTRDFILNIDDDTRIGIDSIRMIVESMIARPIAGVLFPQILDLSSGRQFVDYDDTTPANFLGGCHVVRREALTEVGPLDPECNFGGEELDFSIRMRLSGWQVVYDPSIQVVHNGLPRARDTAVWRQTQWVRNYSRVLFKYFPSRVANLFVLRVLISHVVSGSRRHGFKHVLKFARASSEGRAQGMSNRNLLPQNLVDFYRDTTRRPDLGNVPLSTKAVRRIRRRLKLADTFSTGA